MTTKKPETLDCGCLVAAGQLVAVCENHKGKEQDLYQNLTELENMEAAIEKVITQFNSHTGLKRSNSLLVLGQKFNSYEKRCIKLAQTGSD